MTKRWEDVKREHEETFLSGLTSDVAALLHDAEDGDESVAERIVTLADTRIRERYARKFNAIAELIAQHHDDGEYDQGAWEAFKSAEALINGTALVLPTPPAPQPVPQTTGRPCRCLGFAHSNECEYWTKTP
jgi:hypothetical protein